MSLKIHVGKWYVDGMGDVLQITNHDPSREFGFRSNYGLDYREDGQHRSHTKSSMDIVREVAGPNGEAIVPAPAKFGRDQMAWEIYRDWQGNVGLVGHGYSAASAYTMADIFLAEMAKQHEAKPQ